MLKNELLKVIDVWHKINIMLTKQQKRYGVYVFLCTLVAAVFETIGVSAILPVVEALLNPGNLKEKWYVKPLVSCFNISDDKIIMLLICIMVILIYIVKNLFSIFQVWISKKYSYKIKRELGCRVMQAYMKQGYIFFVNNNSSRLMQGITGDISGVYGIINNFFSLATKCFTIIAIAIFIMLSSPLIALVLLLLAGVCVITFQVIFRKSMRINGELLREASWDNSQATLEAIQGSKEVLVANRQDYFVNKYEQSLTKHNEISIKVDMAQVMPAYLIEMVCVAGLLIGMLFQIQNMENSYELVSSLSVIAVSAFRILPAVGAMTSSINSIMSSIPSFNAAYETLEQVRDIEEENAEKAEVIEENNARFRDEIVFQNIYYKYPNSDKVILNNVSFSIKVNSSIGLIGTSGAGKTTLVDILLGLFVPQKGSILMDGIDIQSLGKNWNKIIGYVPQNIYLVDATVRENVAFGIAPEKIDDQRVWKAIEMAQLKKFIEEQPEQLDTLVGEWGVKFSGGQRQRLAIARALYDNPDILVLDEATAALDNETEKAVMEAIEALQGQKTLIVVAHRLTTIKQCDFIYEVRDGKVILRDKNDVL